MRLYCVTLLIGATAATGASASSFVTVAAPASPSSIVYYGKPAPVMSAAASVATDLPALNYPLPLPPAAPAVAPATPASPSVVALGEPAVENFQVAAIAEKKPANRRPDFAPMVIRGGISGEMFARESSPVATPASSQPEPAQASAAPTRQTKPEQRRTPEPTPEPVAAPAPSTLGRMPGVQ